MIKVERSGTRANKPYQPISYYLCSLSPQSHRLADGIRGHWLIEREGRWGFPHSRTSPSLSNHAVENALHWVKDVIYEEDISPQKAGFAPRNLILAQNLGFNSFKNTWL